MSVKAPPNTVLVIAGSPYQLRWDKAAMFRADELGLFDRKKPGIGFAAAAKYVFAMAPDALREKHPSPEKVAEAMPPLNEVWDAINNAIDGAKEDADPKNVFGSTSGRSPASSSDSAKANTGA